MATRARMIAHVDRIIACVKNVASRDSKCIETYRQMTRMRVTVEDAGTLAGNAIDAYERGEHMPIDDAQVHVLRGFISMGRDLLSDVHVDDDGALRRALDDLQPDIARAITLAQMFQDAPQA